MQIHLEGTEMHIHDLPSLEGIRDFYILSKTHQFSSPANETRYADEKDSWVFDWSLRQYRFIHRWKTDGSQIRRYGTETILWRGEPIWQIEYGGYCPRELLAPLRIMHTRAYKRGIFHGGRGLPVDQTLVPGVIYRNAIHAGFERARKIQFFRGDEMIRSLHPFWHQRRLEGRFWYQGGLVKSSFTDASALDHTDIDTVRLIANDWS